MKTKLLIVLCIVLFIGVKTTFAQTVTLGVIQDYPLPEIPTITQNGDTLKSSVLTGTQWYKDGTKIEGATQSSVVISQSGTYSVSVTNSAGCSSSSINYAAIKTDVPVIQAADFTCKVYPNPNNGLFTVEFESSQSNPIALELYSADGKSVAKQRLKYSSGKQTIQFGKAKLVGGVYSLHIKFGDQIVVRKLIVNQ